jgi:hypothetical protein
MDLFGLDAGHVHRWTGNVPRRRTSAGVRDEALG